MKRIIFLVIILFATTIFAQEKPKESDKVVYAKEQLQKLQAEYQKLEENYKKVSGEYFLSIQALQQQASVYQSIINSEKKEEIKK